MGHRCARSLTVRVCGPARFYHSFYQVAANADEVVLETEVTNPTAIALYEKLGFARDKMLFRYYLNGVDAIRLKLWLK